MNVLILDGGPRDGRGASCRALAAMAAGEARTNGHAVAAFELDGLDIKPCQGCFACWVKHPGICAIKDDQRDVLAAMAAADLEVWITPITFGGYAPALKRSLDRFIPNALPFFELREGEIHHPLRYPRRRGLIVLGTRPDADSEAERTFEDLVRRNALNLAAVLSEAIIVHDGETEEVEERLRLSLRAAEEAI
jgi:multimeric flavodoxin WrbA